MSDAVQAAELAVEYLKQQVCTLFRKAEAVRADEEDAIHKARVATRRARSALRVWGPLFRGEPVNGLRYDLRWYGEQLGRPRDTEVLIAHMSDLLEETAIGDPVRSSIMGELRMLHEGAHGLLVATMASSRYEYLMSRLDDFVEDPPVVPQESGVQVIPAMVEEAAARVSSLRDLSAALGGDEAALSWHETRKAAKAVRYALEAIRDHYGSRFNRLVEQWKQVTEELGLFQDSAIVRELLEPMAALASRRGLGREPYDELLAAQQAHSDRALEAGRLAVEEALAGIGSVRGLLG